MEEFIAAYQFSRVIVKTFS